jgi:hypothetical protein
VLPEGGSPADNSRILANRCARDEIERGHAGAVSVGTGTVRL